MRDLSLRGQKGYTDRLMCDETILEKVIFIIGPTCVGKTSLSIEIARTMDGEVVNCDALQMYEGLDILTNRVSDSEMCGVSHHLFGFLSPTENFNVIRYVGKSIETIQSIIRRGKTPIVVGGTNLYVEGLLYCLRESENSQSTVMAESIEKGDGSSKQDTTIEGLIHPNDVYRLKKAYHRPFKQNMQLRLLNHRIIYLTCSNESLYKERVEVRSSAMLRCGGLSELFQFYSQHYMPMDDRKLGLCKALGVPEFYSLYCKNADQPLDKLVTSREFVCARESFIRNTLRYAKRQRKWIHNRFLTDANLTIKTVDSTNWSQDPVVWVKETAKECVQFIESSPSTLPGHRPKPKMKKWNPNSDLEKMRECEVCSGVRIFGNSQWQAHLQSRRHRRLLKRLLRTQSTNKKPSV